MKILFSLILLLITTADQEMSSKLKTNRDIIDSLAIDVILNYQDRMSGGSVDSILINVGKLNRDAGNYLRVLIGNFFSEKSFRVFRNYNDVSSFQGLVIEIDNFDIGIGYSKPFEKTFLGMNYIYRQIHLKLKGQIYRSNNQIVEEAIDQDVTFNDEIPYHSISEVEVSQYGFTKGKRTDFSFWEKLYEPAIVIVSVAVIVYLFFAQRS